MEVFQTLVERELREIEMQRQICNFSNVTKKEQIALNLLKKNPNIVVRSTNKGDSVVVLDKGLYKKEISMLSDKKVYKHLTCDPTINTIQCLDGLLRKGVSLGVINEN